MPIQNRGLMMVTRVEYQNFRCGFDLSNDLFISFGSSSVLIENARHKVPMRTRIRPICWWLSIINFIIFLYNAVMSRDCKESAPSICWAMLFIQFCPLSRADPTPSLYSRINLMLRLCLAKHAAARDQKKETPSGN